MTKWAGDGYAAPADYTELFDQYYALVTHIVRKNGIREADVEDVARDILVTFMEKDAMSWYRPPCYCDRPKLHKVDDRKHECRSCGGLLFRHRTGWKRSRFPGFLRDWVGLYVRQHRDRQMVRDQREPYRLMTEVDHELTVFVERMRERDAYSRAGSAEAQAIGAADREAWLMRARLAVREAGRDRLDVLFEAVVSQLDEYGDVRHDRLADEMRCSSSTVTVMLKELRRELRTAGLAEWRSPW